MIAVVFGSPIGAMSSPYVINSSHPPYFAEVDGDRLLSLTIDPAQLGLDMNSENSIRSETNALKPARYHFPNAVVPRTVLSHLKDVYRYDRRRDVPIVSSSGDWVIAEYFRANSHIPMARFRLLGNTVQRQEQLDSSGRVRRIVLVGWAPRNSSEDDEQSNDASPLGDHPAWIRVLAVSTTGQKTLVAVAWKNKIGTSAVQSTDEPKSSDLYFGLPDGTRRWHSMDEFAKSQGIDLRAESLLNKFHR